MRYFSILLAQIQFIFFLSLSLDDDDDYDDFAAAAAVLNNSINLIPCSFCTQPHNFNMFTRNRRILNTKKQKKN